MDDYKELLMQNKRCEAFLFVLSNHMLPEME